MALAKPAPTTLLTGGSAAAGGTTATALSDPLDTQAAIQVAAEVVFTCGSAMTKACRLQCFGALDSSTGNYSTSPFVTYDLAIAGASGTYRHDFGVANSPRYMKFSVLNLDTAVAISDVTINVQPQNIV